MKKNVLRNIVFFSIGLLVFFYLFFVIGFDECYNLLLKIKIEYFFLSAFFYLLSEAIITLALKTAIKQKIGFLKIFSSHLAGMFYSAFTPGRVGYYYTAFSLAKKTGSSKSANIGIITFIQGVNFVLKVLFCFLALIYFSTLVLNSGFKNYLFLAIIIPLILGAAIFLILYTNFLNKILSIFPVFHKFARYIEIMQKTCQKINREDLFKIILLSFLGWFTLGCQWFFIGMSLGIGISFFTALMLQSLVSAIMFVPFSPSGFGFTEGGNALLFKIIGYSLAGGVVFMIIVRINCILIDSIGLLLDRKT